MRQSIFLKSFIILGAVMAVVGGGAFVGFRHASEVRGDTEPFGALSETYTHPSLGFSFRYPASFMLSELAHSEGGETILVEEPDSLRTKQAFQVFTMPYDEDGPLTEARIKEDQPDIAMDSVASVQVAGVPAIGFVQFQTDDVGKTYEVWFVHNGMLYEVATYGERAPALQEILSTWTFRP